MLTAPVYFNYSIIISFLYFANYAFTFLLFFLIIFNIVGLNNNISFILSFLNYSKKIYLFFVLTLVAFLGIPPFALFAPKFLALVNIWVYSSWFFFCFTLLAVFLSFALYLQIFDTLFSFKRNTGFRIASFDLSGLFSAGLFYSIKKYNNFKNLTVLAFLILTGFIYFKDLFLFLTMFI